MIDPDDRFGWIVISYCLCIFFIVAFGVYGITYAIFLGKREAVHAAAGSAEHFTTAKRSQGMWRIGWSFFCGAIGGWVISSPANFSTWGGYIMLITYPIATGIPILIIAYCGNRIIEKYPMCCSLGDFVAWRWGPTAKLFVACVTMLNMAIFLLAELTLIGALFESYVGDRSYPIIIVTSLVTTIYTAYGGLLVSIITDQAQAILSVIILVIISIYLCVEFRQPLPENFGGNDALGAQFYGYSSILTLPVSLIAATAFSEQVWQRCWASESPQTLRRGAWIGFVSVTIFVFLAGFYGYMAAWSGLIDFENTNVNVYLFQVFKRSPTDGGYTVNNWITVLVLILAAIMNESAVDSILNGMVATVSSQFFRGQGLFWCRILTFIIMIPIVVLATQQYSIDQIFLLGNILCSCGFIPLYLGLVDHPKAHMWLSESNLIFSFSMSILTVTAYGMAQMNSFTLGAEMAWWLNSYSWDYFAVSTFTSVGYMIFFAACKEALARFGIEGTPISEITMKIPGFKFLAGHWEQDIDVEGDTTHAAKLAKLGPDSPPSSGIADPVAEPYLKSPPTAPYAQYYPQYAGAAPPPAFHMMQGGVPAPAPPAPPGMGYPQQLAVQFGMPRAPAYGMPPQYV